MKVYAIWNFKKKKFIKLGSTLGDIWKGNPMEFTELCDSALFMSDRHVKNHLEDLKEMKYPIEDLQVFEYSLAVNKIYPEVWYEQKTRG